MKPTHYYHTHSGKRVNGIVTGHCCWNTYWFLCLCDDGKTWMKEPVCVPSPIKIS